MKLKTLREYLQLSESKKPTGKLSEGRMSDYVDEFIENGKIHIIGNGSFKDTVSESGMTSDDRQELKSMKDTDYILVKDASSSYMNVQCVYLDSANKKIIQVSKHIFHLSGSDIFDMAPEVMKPQPT